MHTDLIEKLERRLKGPLPGAEAQYRMAHAVRRHPDKPPADARLAAVLALFYPWQAQWHLALIERQNHHAADRHRGQISFPGGRYEKRDGHPVNTALRETEEEIGVEAASVSILGALTELYIPVSNFLVKPFVGFVTERPRFRAQEEEVRAILETPFDLLRHPNTIQTTDMQIAEHLVLRQVPFFNVHNKAVWGATAMMISELLHLTEDFPLGVMNG